MNSSNIEWTDATWNPTKGCSRVSPGCENCYAERQAIRQAGPGGKYEGLVKSTPKGPRWTGVVRLDEDKLREPLSLKKPRRVFVNSMSDLFHESLPDETIDRVFAVMACAPRQTFQVLTKRAERMREYLTKRSRSAQPWKDAARTVGHALEFEGISLVRFPLPNVWLGVSVEDQKRADERILPLLETPAALRFLSVEPLLGPVDVRNVPIRPDNAFAMRDPLRRAGISPPEAATAIDWVIVGGESGPGARPMHPAWARAIRDQCEAAGVPFFFKQTGAWTEVRPPLYHRVSKSRFSHESIRFRPDGREYVSTEPETYSEPGMETLFLVPRAKGGSLDEIPEDLRVRQFPRERKEVENALP